MNRFGIYILIFFLLPIYSLTFSQTTYWKKQQSPVNTTLRNLMFTDSLTGWAAGEMGTIIHTSDGGRNWGIQNSTVQTFILDIYFINKDVGWALTLNDVFPFNSAILKTTNGGTGWIKEDYPDNGALMRTIFFFDSLNGFIGGSHIAYTTDGGSNWTKAVIDSGLLSNLPVIRFKFLNQRFGYACGGRIDLAGVIWRTTNSGLNWSSTSISPDEIFDVFIFDSLNAVSLSGDPEGFFGIANINTTDSGLSWNYKELTFFGLSFALDFRVSNEGWSASGYKFIFTSDGGINWAEIETPDSSVIYDLQFTDSRTGYAAGDNGVILKYSLPPDTTNTPPNIFELFQNFPNPFNTTTRIRFNIPALTFVTLKLFDILGNEVVTVLKEEKPANTYEVDFSANDKLASGVYFYQLNAGDYIATKKMIYLK
jgi:photosystem II stability/assembly factor-like uncharacterized protein